MSRLGRLLSAVGLASLGAGTVLTLDPSLAVRPALTRVVAGLGNGYLPVAGVGVLALLWATAVGTDWAIDGPAQATMPDREAFVPVAAPGGEFDVAVAELAGRRGRAARPVAHREAIRERLRSDAVRTLVVCQGYGPAEAEAAVAAGVWTDDRFAAEFLATDEDAPTPRWHQRLWRWLRRADTFEVRATRAADEILALEGVDR